MRMYLGCYVYDDSAGPRLPVCGHFGHKVLNWMDIYAMSCSHKGWGRVARHYRMAKLFIRWLASPSGLFFEGWP